MELLLSLDDVHYAVALLITAILMTVIGLILNEKDHR